MKITVTNPATLAPVAHMRRSSIEDVDACVRLARKVQPGWARLDPGERGTWLRQFADLVDAHSGEISRALTAEQGKPLGAAEAEVAGFTRTMRHFAGAWTGEPRLIEAGAEDIVTLRPEPLGVVAAIVPWNFPLLLLGWKLGPALATGNAVVIKPAPSTPVATRLVVDLAARVFPEHLVSMVLGEAEVGTALVEHPDIAKVSFTGSTPTGMSIMRSAASGLKRLTLELGGNDAAIVLDDVDVEAVARQVGEAAFRNSGQVCIAVKRLYVAERIADEFAEAMAAALGGMRLGNGLDRETDMGPVHSQAQLGIVDGLIADARAHGARIVGTAAEPELPGWFRSPTLATGVSDSALLVEREQFGPVLPILTFRSVDDAVARANGSSFGLGASVWSADIERAAGIAPQLAAGTVWVNRHGRTLLDVPFGGWGHSGLGHELGDRGLEEYVKYQALHVPRTAPAAAS